MTDEKIIQLYFDRNEQAITQTAEKYGRLTNSIAYNILNNREDAEECVNDTYAGLWNAIPPEKPRNFTAFICKIARNLSLKRLEYLTREKRSPDITLSLEELSDILPDNRYSPEISEEDIGKAISDFLRTEKQDSRNVFIRRYYFFDSVKEISKRFDFTESKVKNMLFATRNKLKDYLIKEGIEI